MWRTHRAWPWCHLPPGAGREAPRCGQAQRTFPWRARSRARRPHAYLLPWRGPGQARDFRAPGRGAASRARVSCGSRHIAPNQAAAASRQRPEAAAHAPRGRAGWAARCSVHAEPTGTIYGSSGARTRPRLADARRTRGGYGQAQAPRRSGTLAAWLLCTAAAGTHAQERAAGQVGTSRSSTGRCHTPSAPHPHAPRAGAGAPAGAPRDAGPARASGHPSRHEHRWRGRHVARAGGVRHLLHPIYRAS